MSDNHDYSADIDTPVPDNIMAQLSNLAQEQKDLEDKVMGAESELKTAQASLREIKERTLPDLMEEVGMQMFTTSSGLKVALDDKIFANITKPKMTEGVKWLRDRGFEALIKNLLTVNFTKGEAGQAKELLLELIKREFNVDQKETVNGQTLSAWVREKMEEGYDLDEDLLGIHHRKVSKIS